MQEEWRQKTKEIQKEIDQALARLKHREHLTRQEAKILRKKLCHLYIALQDAKFKAGLEGRVFRKRMNAVWDGPA